MLKLFEWYNWKDWKLGCLVDWSGSLVDNAIKVEVNRYWIVVICDIAFGLSFELNFSACIQNFEKEILDFMLCKKK